MYVIIDLKKLRCETVELIGEDYGIKPDEQNIHWDNIEGYERYLDKIINYLIKQTEEFNNGN